MKKQLLLFILMLICISSIGQNILIAILNCLMYMLLMPHHMKYSFLKLILVHL